ncbi:MAG: AAA family ATPase [Patescibacteria group bacterium]|nr:AAA family ATPase [Patescibacteria group bacterium]
MSNVPKIVCLVGPSGVGKTSFTRRLTERYDLRLPTVVTTRKARIDDDGRYKYVTEEEFVSMIGQDYFLEWDKYMDYYYGTPMHCIPGMATCSLDRIMLLDLTPKGCLKVRTKFPDALIIALLPDDPTWLETRLIGRNSQPMSEIKARVRLLHEYLAEIERLPDCKKVFVSFSPESWDRTSEEIASLI